MKNPKLTVSSRDDVIFVGAEGYGDNGTQEGYGYPVAIEYYEGKLQLLVWADINQADPTHKIDLEGARDDKRT